MLRQVPIDLERQAAAPGHTHCQRDWDNTGVLRHHRQDELRQQAVGDECRRTYTHTSQHDQRRLQGRERQGEIRTCGEHGHMEVGLPHSANAMT